ncbi:MAG: glycerate kinase [Symploca sp. SIO3C6]|uniref:Glycerate kinase n=1 Tax=Symploca sp. SIO1C4 TaxID=2607765 RepID=A0A6B3NCU5_9CYAN|nr:glycerate kinase [Symploca sp. SIO3C6]NER26978.1 glycerate kinase [Symploca sp. SIO1C4]
MTIISLSQILNNWIQGQTPTAFEWQQLAREALAVPQQAKAFGITPANVEEEIQARGNLFQVVYPEVFSLEAFRATTTNEQFKTLTLLSLWNLWLPLALQLASLRQRLGRPLIQGILGVQGTGKTTLAAILSLILAHLGYRTLSLSLDDLYKTYQERQRLQQQDPRLIWRGPPGTHDLELGIELLEQLRSTNGKQQYLVPRFDKSAWGGAGDRTTPDIVTDIDIVLFEGWFVGVRPINSEVFNGSVPTPIDSPADQLFARDMNGQLKNYVPLWEKLDRLIILYPVDYRFSLQWRLQAEQQMIATGKSGMTDSQISDFVKYFWKSLHPELFIAPLIKNPSLVDLVIEINRDHSFGAIYQPSDLPN